MWSLSGLRETTDTKTKRLLLASVLVGAVVSMARAELPEWMQHAVSGSTIEGALYRMMQLPGLQAMFPRPPKEAAAKLGGVIASAPNDAELYSLRAMEEEQALDFGAAEADWKSFAAKSQDGVTGTLELANFYHRRLRPVDEAAQLMLVAKAPAVVGVRNAAPTEQRSWQAFERLLALAADQTLPDATVEASYAAWIDRYPDQPLVYARYLHWLLAKKKFDDATGLIAQYRRTFPQDDVFPVKATALAELGRGNGDAASVAKALAVYDAAFQQLWPAELIDSFYSLLNETHRAREFLADARDRLARNPDDVNALARIFYYYQHQGRLDAAEQEVNAFRISKDARKSAWSANELYTLASMMDAAGAYPEAARYDYALYHVDGAALLDGRSPQEAGLAAMIELLLKAPDQPIELGSGNLSMYRDIATLDRGPGYWNGILSLWFNSSDPAQELSAEEQKAQPYFHQKKAAELLSLLDRTIPTAAERPELHAKLIAVDAEYGQTATVIADGEQFLKEFPAAPQRLDVADLMADSYARLGDTQNEFALYDRMLAELAAKAGNTPLTDAGGSEAGVRPLQYPRLSAMSRVSDETTLGRQSVGDQTSDAQSGDVTPSANKVKSSRAFDIAATPPVAPTNAAAVQYFELLNRYLGRLTAMRQTVQALAVLRHELDRSPNDPLLYERLAEFMGQNNLSAQQEDVYKAAMSKFPDKSWYDRLARLYLRERRREAFADLTRKVTDTFSGTELDAYFANVPAGGPPPGPQMYLQLNLFAAKRFPHDMVFVQNLLRAHLNLATHDPVAWEALLRQHWWESDGLRSEFFDYLSRTGKLDAELTQLRQIAGKTGAVSDPAAARELVEIDLWNSHFEQSAPLLETLAKQYPTDATICGEAMSVFRSLAYYDPNETPKAVVAEKNLLAGNPYDTTALATLGDLYAEQKAGGHENLAAAAPFWRRIPAVHPGSHDGYLEAATIFWDYFEFDDAMREIREARTKFGQPALYGYEAGAIAEGKRDPAAAVTEYTAQAVSVPDEADPARGRLLQLSQRPAYRTLIDQATAREVTQQPSSSAALALRADVLTQQDRRPEIAPLLQAAMVRASTVDDAAEIASIAQAHQMIALYEQALARQAELASDPVEKMELQYTRARSMEGRADVADAGRVIEAVYRENPKILGVVRATADFYWRNSQRPQAIRVLLIAAKDSQPELGLQFTLEAANKANESGDTNEARLLAMELLSHSPFDARFVAAAAESFARAGDNTGLKQFYLDRMALVHAASGLSADESKQDTVLLRRGLIPALTRVKDPSGAVDQYIAIMSAYPEDEGTAQEAALYALQQARQNQLLGFFRKTVHDSPKDSRFAILLAQTETTFDDLPAAIAAYSQAIAVRKDRVDLYTARAGLEERLQRFDDACTDFERLYLLSYRDPAWAVKEAELRARQGRTTEVVKALETAWVMGRPAAAKNEFLVAAQLEKWNLLAQAGEYADKGWKLAGDNLLLPSNTGSDESDAATYARIETRLGKPDLALATLLAARKAADTLPLSLLLSPDQLKDAHLSMTDWRRMQTQQRQSIAAGPFQSAMRELGSTMAAYASPEQKLAYAQVLESHRKAGDLELGLAIEQASLSGLKDNEADWRKERMLANARRSVDVEAYVQLQRSRMRFMELAKTMEAYADMLKPEQREGVRLEAANAYRDSGDEASEMRVLRSMVESNNTGVRGRYLALVLKRAPTMLNTLAGSSDEALADDALNVAVASGTDPLARSALDERGRTMQPVWRRAYTSLVGLYQGDKTTRTDGAFREALDDSTIGQRLGHPADRTQQLAGDTWFYYGMRYGVYRTSSAQGEPEDYLPAELEHGPALEANYTALAEAYTDAQKIDLALLEYGHALEIDADDAGVDRRMAVLLWSVGRKDAAMARWRDALAALVRVEDRGAAPESFWTDFAAVMEDLGRRHLMNQLRENIDAVVRPYLARNAEYRSSELLGAVYRAAPTPAEGMAWVMSLCEAAKSPIDVLDSLADAEWLPLQEREPLYLRRIELQRVAAQASAETLRQGAGTDGEARDGSGNNAASRLLELQQSLVLFYLGQHEDAKARAALDAIPQTQRESSTLQRAAVLLAARSGGLPALLANYRSDPTTAPDSQTLQDAASALENPNLPLVADSEQWEGGGDRGQESQPDAAQATAANANIASDWLNARAILEYVLAREQRSHAASTANFVALAESRLHTGDLDGAVMLLHQMTALEGDVYADYDMAASLLERSGQPGAAVEFLATLAKNVPWDASFRLRLAEAQITSGKDAEAARSALRTIAASGEVDYNLRVRAAEDLGSGGHAGDTGLGSAELDLIATANHDAKAAQQPYFAAARRVAARFATDSNSRAELLLEALAIAPDDRNVAETRLGIFEEEYAARQDALAASAIEPVLNGLLQTDANGAAMRGAIDMPKRPVSVDRAQLADLVATTYERLGNQAQALQYLASAIRWQQNISLRATLEARRAKLVDRMSLDTANAERRPIISKELDQSNLVRPRLTTTEWVQRQVLP
jgi:hypothetical protein